jgi:hypothetical protein
MNPTEDFDRQDRVWDEEDYIDLEDKWYEIEDDYRERFTTLTDDDVYFEEGRFEDMLERIGRRRGKSQREIRSEIENW